MTELITTPIVEIVTDAFCRQCGRGLGPTDNFCGECGTGCRDLIEVVDPASQTSLKSVAANPAPVASTSGGQTINAVINNRLAVIGIIALVGPLGLPALWLSPRFSKPTKIITTTAYVVVTTVLPIAIVWYWLDYSVRPLVEVFGK